MMQTCVDCHFLAENRVQANPPFHSEMVESLRKKAKNNKWDWIEGRKPSCYFGVWESPKAERLENILLNTNRKDFCFYWPYRPGMLFRAAETLQRREVQAWETAKDRRYIIWGLWIAGIALAVNAFLEILDRL